MENNNNNNNEQENLKKFEDLIDQLFDKDEQGNILKAKNQQINNNNIINKSLNQVKKQKLKLGRWYKQKQNKEVIKKEQEKLEFEYFFGMYSTHFLKFLEQKNLIVVNDADNFHEYVMRYVLNINENFAAYKEAVKLTGSINVDFILSFKNKVEEEVKKEE